MSFVHLHLHTHYSLLDGLGKPEDYIKKAKEVHNAPAIAITDHGVLYGALEFYQKCKQYDIKPIIGCEAYICKGSRHDKSQDNKYNHILLLAKNFEGYKNLIQLVTYANIEGFYYKPRIDFELLEKYSDNLIATSGCLGSLIPESIRNHDGNLDDAIKLVKKFQKIFGKENFFLEVQHHPNIEQQGWMNERIFELAEKTEVPVVATNDCHYVEKEDAQAHDALICIQTGKTVYDEHRMRYADDYSLRSPEEMREAFKDHPEVCDNTLKIAEMCNIEIPLNNNLLPPFTTPDGMSVHQYLTQLCEDGLKKRYGNPSDEAKSRLKYELEIIEKMGYSSYFLIVWDFVKYAKEQGIIVGPGRGSAAGAIIAYVLEITDIDPLPYNLLFERFLNPERVSMPDIDIDFADKRRDEVLEYVQKKYGKDRVAQIITFGTLAARAAVRDAGRVLGFSYSEVDQIAKAIPSRPGTKLQEALDTEEEMKQLYGNNPNAKKVIDTALKLEGCIRHSSVHACAVVISDKSLTEYTPLQIASGQEDAIVTQYSMKPIEKIGLLKMDFLGLKNLSIMETTLLIIERIHGKHIDLLNLDLRDEVTYDLLQRGQTTGVFQLESNGMKRYLKELKPTCFEDIIAMVSLYRPGPMEWIPEYIKGKHGKKRVKYMHSSLEEVLEETYGIAVYQEQILQIAQKFAGFSLGEADILRRAIGKKIMSELMSQRQKFIDGAEKQGHNTELAIKIFDEVIEPFAGYGFNKSHAACYAMIALQTAYLKAHYPAEFMAALMTADHDNTDRIIIEIAECKELDIEILPPSVNDSLADFTVTDTKTIRFGLSAIKGVGVNTVNQIMLVRAEGGTFKSLEDFAKRVPSKLLNKKTLEALTYSGALDNLGERNQIIANIPQISEFAKNIQKESNDSQIDLFGMMDEPSGSLQLEPTQPATHIQKLQWEKEYLGMFVSGHPLQGLKEYIASKNKLLKTITKNDLKKIVKICGVITGVKRINTRNGQKMAYIELEDPSAKIEIIAFPKTYAKYLNDITENKIVKISGKLDYRGGRLQCICETFQPMKYEVLVKNAQESNQFNPQENLIISTIDFSEDDGENEPEKREIQSTPTNIYAINLKKGVKPTVLKKLKALLTENQGETPVEIIIEQDKKVQRIKVPFGINLTPTLKKNIETMIATK